MKIKILLCILMMLSFENIFSQPQLVKKWDRDFGGKLDEWFPTMQSTSDGGFILGGFSYSDSCADMPYHQPGGGYWFFKMDSLGIKQWSRLYGGPGGEHLSHLLQASDGGYFLTGSSSSDSGIDKSEDNRDTSRLTEDYWVIKIDPLGNKQWDKTFGGTKDDLLQYSEQTIDGGYILGGYSYSGIGGDKTESSWDTASYLGDYWLVKIDSLGNKQWDKRFGGVDADLLIYIKQTPDKGFIMGGWSKSGASGDRSQPSWGYDDYWIIKTDSLGNKEWDKRFGGNRGDNLFSIALTPEGGYLIGGSSGSDMSSDKSENNFDTVLFTPDYWIINIDSMGNKLWDKSYGGIRDEGSCSEESILRTNDNKYLICTTSGSPHGPGKSEDNLISSSWIPEMWIFKIDENGNKLWDKTIHVTSNMCVGTFTKDSCYAFATCTWDSIVGDKTAPNHGQFLSRDFWIVKYCEDKNVGIENAITANEIALFPNPFTNVLTIYFPEAKKENAILFVYNSIGETILEKEILLEDETLDLSTLPQGIYFVSVRTVVGAFNEKIVKY